MMNHHMPNLNNYQLMANIISFMMYVSVSDLPLLRNRALFSFFLVYTTHYISLSLLPRIAPNPLPA